MLEGGGQDVIADCMPSAAGDCCEMGSGAPGAPAAEDGDKRQIKALSTATAGPPPVTFHAGPAIALTGGNLQPPRIASVPLYTLLATLLR